LGKTGGPSGLSTEHDEDFPQKQNLRRQGLTKFSTGCRIAEAQCVFDRWNSAGSEYLMTKKRGDINGNRPMHRNGKQKGGGKVGVGFKKKRVLNNKEGGGGWRPKSSFTRTRMGGSPMSTNELGEIFGQLGGGEKRLERLSEDKGGRKKNK